MFKKILSHRGRDRPRIIQAAAASSASRRSPYIDGGPGRLHVTYAARTCESGPPPSKQRYLNISSIISPPSHGGGRRPPGYGFLDENAHFAEVLAECSSAGYGRVRRSSA